MDDRRDRADVLTPEQRTKLMRAIGQRNTRPEMAVRKALCAAGLRYRLVVDGLPCRPDLAFPRRRVAVFVHGCFWHGHGCHLFRWPRSNARFWSEKIGRNRQRDASLERAILEAGWRLLTIWECSLRGPTRMSAQELATVVRRFLSSAEPLALQIPALGADQPAGESWENSAS